MSYDVELTKEAFNDLDRLAAALSERWPEGSARLIARFQSALSRLKSFPHACGLAYENRYFHGEVRHLLFEIRKGRSYRALFTIQDHRVRILAIKAPGERPIRPEDLGG